MPPTDSAKHERDKRQISPTIKTKVFLAVNGAILMRTIILMVHIAPAMPIPRALPMANNSEIFTASTAISSPSSKLEVRQFLLTETIN